MTAYNPKQVEEKWLSFWEEKKLFKASSSSPKPAYCIVMPPPNITGVLHMGHALVSTLQDILIRAKRMQGFEVLWVPGTDHAGISTQTVVERHLMRTQSKRRVDYCREEFLSHVWKWKEENEAKILGQLRSLGCSCDWDHLCFTMDEKSNKAVRAAFKKLYDEGLIYRGDYLVNWDPVTQTALADDEVEYEEVSSFLWYIRYPIVGTSDTITIATTRPETMLGDTAVAVFPQDVRYAHLIGKQIKLPLTGRQVSIIADHRIDPEFGTGAVKITPAHDPNDYQMAKDHNLPLLNILTPDAKIKEGAFAGLPVEEARKEVVKALEMLGLIEKIVPHTHRVGHSYRSKAVIQPYLSKQWFVRMEPFKAKLQKAVREGALKLIPKGWEHTYFHWIDNLRDWCISRQLWWGHRIPIWYKGEEILCIAEGAPPSEDWIQDPDVLDTWFSSALWPFSTLGWPEESPWFNKFYPNSVLVTGHDILFFWVARMILMGEFATGKLPFKETFLHGLIYGKSYWRKGEDGSARYVDPKERLSYELGTAIPSDVHSKWEKMSKTKGNVIDPLEMSTSFGTDATRMALAASATHAPQIDLDRRRFEEYKNFANKVWNGARFVFMNLPSPFIGFAKGIDLAILDLEDRWILSRLNRIIQTVTEAIDNYTFDIAATSAYNFFWNEFCAYYVELVKPTLFGRVKDERSKENKQRILANILDRATRLLHPITPFITEEIFSLLKGVIPPGKSTCPYTQETQEALYVISCATAPYPKMISKEHISLEIEELFAKIADVVYAIRNVRGEMKLPPSLGTDLIFQSPSFIKEHEAIIKALIPTKEILYGDEMPKSCGQALIHGLRILIPIPKEQLAKEKERLAKEEERLSSLLSKTEVQLANSEFVTKAPAQLVERLRKQLEETKTALTTIRNQND